MPHEINPPEWFTLTEVADTYTHTFGASKKSRNYTLFQTTQQRFFMLREGILIYYVDEGSPKGCVDICEASTKVVNEGQSDEYVLIEPKAERESNLELSNIVITKEFTNWELNRQEKDKPKEDQFQKVAAKEVAAAIEFHAKIAFMKKTFGAYFAKLLANQQQAVIAGSDVWLSLYKLMKDLIKYINKSANGMQALTSHGPWNGGGAHPLVQKMWQSFAQLLYLQVEMDCTPENPYIPEMVDNYNKFIQSCLARSHVPEVGPGDYDNNDPTMGIVRLNQVLAIQGKFDEYVTNTKMLIDFSLNKSGANLLASTQCVLLAITLRDELGDAAQGKLWASKALEIFESSPNKDHHPLVYSGSEDERRENIKSVLSSF